jgi:hypothetical protein
LLLGKQILFPQQCFHGWANRETFEETSRINLASREIYSFQWCVFPLSSRPPPSIPDASSDVPDNPVISASKELKKPRVDPRLLRRLRPSTARPPAASRHKLQ